MMALEAAYRKLDAAKAEYTNAKQKVTQRERRRLWLLSAGRRQKNQRNKMMSQLLK